MPGAGTSTSDTQKTQQEFGNTASSTSGTSNATGTTAQTQSGASTTGPWQATQPLLSNILGTLNGFSAAPSPGQSDALATLQSGASATPNFGDAGTSAVSNLLGGNYSGMLGNSLGNYSGSLSPYLSSSYLDPMTTPGLSDSLNTMKSDITNSINSQFAAAGRDLSPGNTTALARGLTQGMAPVLTNQYNQNVATQRGAQDALYGASTGNVGMLSGLDTAGVNLAGSIPGLYTAPGSTALSAANTGYALPYQNLGMLSGSVLPIAGLGQSASTTGTTAGSTNTAGTTGTNSTGAYTGAGSGTSNTQNTMSPIAMLSALFSGGGSGGGSTVAGNLGSAAGTGLGMLSGLFA